MQDHDRIPMLVEIVDVVVLVVLALVVDEIVGVDDHYSMLPIV